MNRVGEQGGRAIRRRPGAPQDGEPTVEYLAADQEVLERRAHPRRAVPRVVLILVVALLLVATVGWLVERWREPRLSATQVSRLYERPPQPELRWSPSTPMPARLADLPGAPARLGTEACEQSAPALFTYLPPGSADGYLAPFGLSPNQRSGVSGTARFADAPAAAESFRRLTASLDRCTELVLAGQGGSFQMDITRTSASRSAWSGERVRYSLVSRDSEREELATLVGLQLGNTVTWQTRDRPPGVSPAEDADQAMDAVATRIRAAARS